MWIKEQIAKTIDHAVLKPSLTQRDIVEACEIGKEFGVASVCVSPTDISFAKQLLRGSEVKVSTVIGFPHGYNKWEVKAFESKLAIQDGADELDMVMNIGKFLSDDYDFVKKDIKAVIMEAKKRNVIVKVIIEICYLSNSQIIVASRIAEEAGADYIKTSTGFGLRGGATPKAVELMINAVEDSIGIKASGGIRNCETAIGYLDQGCKRLGTSHTKTILIDLN